MTMPVVVLVTVDATRADIVNADRRASRRPSSRR